ncbi:MAG: hypothetical protein ACXABK_07160, partial [Candidatus Heimdallarchaeaceae archaeon]
MTDLRKEKKNSLRDLKDWRIQIPIIILIFVGLFILTLYYKHVIGDWINSEVGSSFYHTFQNSQGNTVTWYFENYSDAETYYELYLENFRFNGWNPYAADLPIDSENRLDFYLYGPFFIYGIAFISLFVQMVNPGATVDFLIPASVKWTAIVFDALSVSMLYLIIIELKCFKDKNVLRHILGVLGASAFAFLPMNLFYVDAYYLNMPQMTFFTLIAVLLFMKQKYISSSVMFTFAWFSKQIPLFMIIPLFFLLGKKEGYSVALKKFLLPFLLSSFLFSIPWIFMNPWKYAIRIIGAGRPLWYADLNANQHGVTLAHTFLYLGTRILSQAFVYLNVVMIPFLVFYVLAIFIAVLYGEEILEDESKFIIYNSWLVLLIHVFLSRGLFKYYDTFINPFLILAAFIIVDKFVKYIFQKQLSERLTNRKYVRILLVTIFYAFFLLLSIGAISSSNWSIMISSRFLHPLWLLALFTVNSFFLPLKYY